MSISFKRLICRRRKKYFCDGDLPSVNFPTKAKQNDPVSDTQFLFIPYTVIAWGCRGAKPPATFRSLNSNKGEQGGKAPRETD